MEDVIIIGAGIVGSFLAYELSHYDVKVSVIEREHDVANEITMANSAIIHTGYDPLDGTLKAQLNVKGARMYPKICETLQVPYAQIGSFVVAHHESEKEMLMELAQRCETRGIRCVLKNRKEILEMEPNIADDVCWALWIPETAIIDPWLTAIRLMEYAITNGVSLFLDEEVNKIEKLEQGYRVSSNQRHWDSKTIINVAGLGAQEIAQLLKEHPFTITRKRGQYDVISKQGATCVNHILYPLPNALGKGVLAVPTVHGNLLLGPNAEEIEEDDLATTREGIQYVHQQVKRLIKQVPTQACIRSYSGIRPCGNDGDFYLKESETYPGVIHAGCIDSPGLASAPAIAQYILQTFLKQHVSLSPKSHVQPMPSPIQLEKMNVEEKQAWIKAHPSYGHIICRCENISEGEIVESIHRPCGARSIKGVKKRVRPGMGKCQGGFCEVEVAKILARELHLPLGEVVYDAPCSTLGKEAK